MNTLSTVASTAINTLRTSISEGTSFGTSNHARFGSHAIKILSLLIPGAVLGHYIDQGVQKLKLQSKLGNNILSYIGLQTALSITLLYALFKYNKSFTDEFQNTYAGLFFVAMFFNLQSNYVVNLQQFFNSIYHI